MPPRNLVFLFVATVGCIAAWFARERDHRGRLLNEVLNLIDAAYIEEIDPDVLVTAALDGTVSTLDENSAFLRGAGQQELEAALDQRFGGVGLELEIDDRTGTLSVATPIPGGPAWQAGILAGDRIKSIDGESTAGMRLGEAVGRLRGKPGVPVTLTVAGMAGSSAESGPGADRDVRLVREIVLVESVQGDRRLPDGSWEWWLEGESGVALVRITGFGERTAAELDSALTQLAGGRRSAGGAPLPLRGVVIDLRGNPGGLVTSAVDVCDRFLDDGVIVSTRGRDRSVAGGATDDAAADVRMATSGSALGGVPIAVLVDGMTASAAEIVAACLQDHGRATVVGSRTFGKGTVQSILPLSGGGLLKLTTSQYLRPSGATIHRDADEADAAEAGTWGVIPDEGFTVVPSGQSLERLSRWRRRRDAVPGVAVDDGGGPKPRVIDEVLARALDAFPAPSGPAADLGGEEEAPRDAHEPATSGV